MSVVKHTIILYYNIPLQYLVQYSTVHSSCLTVILLPVSVDPDPPSTVCVYLKKNLDASRPIRGKNVKTFRLLLFKGNQNAPRPV